MVELIKRMIAINTFSLKFDSTNMLVIHLSINMRKIKPFSHPKTKTVQVLDPFNLISNKTNLYLSHKSCILKMVQNLKLQYQIQKSRLN